MRLAMPSAPPPVCELAEECFRFDGSYLLTSPLGNRSTLGDPLLPAIRRTFDLRGAMRSARPAAGSPLDSPLDSTRLPDAISSSSRQPVPAFIAPPFIALPEANPDEFPVVAPLIVAAPTAALLVGDSLEPPEPSVPNKAPGLGAPSASSRSFPSSSRRRLRVLLPGLGSSAGESTLCRLRPPSVCLAGDSSGSASGSSCTASRRLIASRSSRVRIPTNSTSRWDGSRSAHRADTRLRSKSAPRSLTLPRSAPRSLPPQRSPRSTPPARSPPRSQPRSPPAPRSPAPPRSPMPLPRSARSPQQPRSARSPRSPPLCRSYRSFRSFRSYRSSNRVRSPL
mmetsp:Transcript_1823/g.2966  ORF Transcript_1823/g.2966 Transcript_1823/m.2966 type:complete len:338 (-) Transcript_1823:42-1055(-)